MVRRFFPTRNPSVARLRCSPWLRFPLSGSLYNNVPRHLRPENRSMKTNRCASILFCILFLAPPFFVNAQQANNPSTTWQVYFSPRGGATDAIVQSLNNARSSIHVQAYFFTSTPIAQSLVRAHRHAVKVLVLLDKSQRANKSSTVNILAGAGISVFIDDVHAIAHNKVMIIDNESTITGSFNFSKAAEERNAENLLIIHSKQLAAKYLENWRIHQRHST